MTGVWLGEVPGQVHGNKWRRRPLSLRVVRVNALCFGGEGVIQEECDVRRGVALFTVYRPGRNLQHGCIQCVCGACMNTGSARFDVGKCEKQGRPTVKVFVALWMPAQSRPMADMQSSPTAHGTLALRDAANLRLPSAYVHACRLAFA